MVDEARSFFVESGLQHKAWFIDGRTLVLPTWRGDWINDTLSLLLTANGVESSNEGIALRIHSAAEEKLLTALHAIAAYAPLTPDHLRLRPAQTEVEKWDWVLPDALRSRSFASAKLDLEGAQKIAGELIGKHMNRTS